MSEVVNLLSERKTGNTEFLIIAGFYIFSLLFYFCRVESFPKDTLVASLYFLVPTGVGLLVFSLFETHRKLVGLIGGHRGRILRII